MTRQLKQTVIVPVARPDESPVSYAERLSAWYSVNSSEGHRKTLGIYFTPASIAQYMGGLCRNGTGHFVRLLDPSAGTGILACAASVSIASAKNSPRHIELTCFEVDSQLRPLLEMALEHLRKWLSSRRIRLYYRIESDDFLLRNGDALDSNLLQPVSATYDAVICNPPYFKIGKSDARARLCSNVVHGQPNIYGLFMAVGAALLREGGRFVFITPRSYASGPYFRRFRELFFRLIRPSDFHVFDSRKEAFSSVLQETVITAGTRLSRWERNAKGLRIRLTSSAGAEDVGTSMTRTLPLAGVLRGDCQHRILHFPANKIHDRASAIVQKWRGTLHDYGWEVSTGPVVAFRAREHLRDSPGRGTIPLLWLQNVKAMETRWPVETRKAQHLASKEPTAIVVPNRNYVLLRRFSAKEDIRRLTAAPLVARRFRAGQLGLENHLNYVHKPGGELTVDEIYGLAALLNSELLDTYFRISSGNTQASATELRAMRLPSLAVIRKIGTQVRSDPDDLERIVNAATA